MSLLLHAVAKKIATSRDLISILIVYFLNSNIKLLIGFVKNSDTLSKFFRKCIRFFAISFIFINKSLALSRVNGAFKVIYCLFLACNDQDILIFQKNVIHFQNFFESVSDKSYKLQKVRLFI